MKNTFKKGILILLIALTATLFAIGASAADVNTGDAGGVFYTAIVDQPLYLSSDVTFSSLNDSVLAQTGQSIQYIMFDNAGNTYGWFYSSSGTVFVESIPYMYGELASSYFLSHSEGSEEISMRVYYTTTQYLTFAIHINCFNADSQIITYTTEDNKVVTFAEADFNNVALIRTGTSLSRIYINDANSNSGGKIVYNYTDTNTFSEISGSAYFTYNGTSPRISSLTFIPRAGFTGIAEFEYTAYTTTNESYKGKIRITVGSVDNLNYRVDSNGLVRFDRQDFNEFCLKYTDEPLHYVVFTLPESSKGKLVYGATSRTAYTTNVSADERYYFYESPYLGEVAFLPSGSYTGNAEIEFTVYTSSGVFVKGKIIIGITLPKTLNYTTTSDKFVTFQQSDFESVVKAFSDAEIEYVTFTQPDAKGGTLTYNFGNPVPVSPKYQYKLDESPMLKYVSFTPAANFSGKVTILYMAYTETSAISGTIIVDVTAAHSQSKPKSDYFTDVDASYAWAAGAIDYLYEEKVVNGMTATTYVPGANIKRGDFILMLYRAYNLNAAFSENFSDVPTNSYYYQAIGVAKAMGIAQGRGDNKFDPDSSITRQEAFTLILRTLDKVGVKLDSTKTVSFNDQTSVASYAADAIKTLANAGVLDPDANGNIRPNENLIRVDMAVALYRILILD